MYKDGATRGAYAAQAAGTAGAPAPRERLLNPAEKRESLRTFQFRDLNER